MTDVVTVGCGSSCAGCRLEEAIRLAGSGKGQYLALDRQAERGTAQFHMLGYRGLDAVAPEVARYCRELFPVARQHGVGLITNGGGEDPEAALRLALDTASAAGLDGYSVAATTNVDARDVVTALDPIVVETG